MISRRNFLRLGLGAVVVAGAGYYGLNQTLGRTVFSVLSEKRQIPVFLYHRIGQQVDDMTITAERFEADLIALKRAGCYTLSLSEWTDYLAGDGSLPEKAVLLTFDDGYLNNYTTAYPLLQKYNYKAAFFVITGFVGQPERMNWEQIRELQTTGMDIGSHTVSHKSLSGLSQAELKEELGSSKKVLEDRLGQSVQYIAYPCGSYNQDVVKITEACGYEGAFTTRYGLNDRAISPYESKRIPLFHFDRSLEYVLVRRGWLASASV